MNGPRPDFTHRLTHPLPGHGARMRSWLLHLKAIAKSGHRKRLAKQIEPHLVPSWRKAGPREVAVTWVGHATCIIQMGGLTLLTDPVWSADLKGIRRLTEPALPLETIGKIDGVLLSHNHYDHLDWPTLERLPKDTPCFVGAGLARDFLKRGFRNVQELDWWQEEVLGPLRIAFVPAHHWSRRTLFDLNKTLWGGWVVTDQDGRRVYFAGDTAYGPFFHAIRQEYPGIDIALFPVGAYAPGWYNRNSHTNPEEAVQAVRDVGARVMVPIHWGTFPLSVEPWLEPIERTRDAWDAAGLPRRDLWDLELGETAKLPIPARPSRPVPKKARRVLISPQGKA